MGMSTALTCRVFLILRPLHEPGHTCSGRAYLLSLFLFINFFFCPIFDFSLDLAQSQHIQSAGMCPSSLGVHCGLWTGAQCRRGQQPRSMWPFSPALT